jgi:hypothetical protein
MQIRYVAPLLSALCPCLPLATALALAVHLVAARAAPDVAVLLDAAAVNSAGKELHAAVVVLVEVELKQPAVEVVTGCLEAIVDLLHDLIAAGCAGSGGGGVGVALRPMPMLNSFAQMGCRIMRLVLNSAGTASMLMVTPAPRRPWKVVLAARAGGFPVHDDQVCTAAQELNDAGLPAAEDHEPVCCVCDAEPADSQLEELFAELPSCSPAAQEDVPVVAGLLIALEGREPLLHAQVHPRVRGYGGEARPGPHPPEAPTELHKPTKGLIRACNGGFASLPLRAPGPCRLHPESLLPLGTASGYACALTCVVRSY